VPEPPRYDHPALFHGDRAHHKELKPWASTSIATSPLSPFAYTIGAFKATPRWGIALIALAMNRFAGNVFGEST
jgi:hypothetical protein